MAMDFQSLKFDVNTKPVIQIGYPMSTSTIGLMYSSIAAALGINGFMFMKEVQPEQLPEFVAGAKAVGAVGISITMPCKSAIVPLLDETDEIAAIYGAVNVVKISPDGHTKGYPFDCYGLVGALENTAGLDLSGKRVMMIGAGSICGPISYNLAKHGVTHIDIFNRTLERAQRIVDLTTANTSATMNAYPLENDALDEAAKKCDILIQCTSVGMSSLPNEFAYLGFLEHLKKDAFVYDVITNETPLLRRAKELGINCLGGIHMILCQVGLAFQEWFGITWGEKENKIAMDVWEQISSKK